MTNDQQIQLLRSLYKNGLTFDQLCDKLERGEHFTFSRFGDGEMNAIYSYLNNKPGANCDGHEYFPEMGKELGEILKAKRPYHVGIDMSERPEKVKKTVGYLVDNGLTDKEYTRSDLFHTALVDGKFERFINTLKGCSFMVIGPSYLNKKPNRPYLFQDFNFSQFISIPESNCWLASNEVLTKIDKGINSDYIFYNTILFVASMAANVWIDRLWQKYGDSVTLIDLGSALDPYCGKQTRSFHKKLNAIIRN